MLTTDTLIKISPSLPKDTIIPFPFSKDLANLLYKNCDAHTHITDDVLGYIISLLLTNRWSLTIFKLIPVPTVLENKRYLYIHTEESIQRLYQTRSYHCCSQALGKQLFVYVRVCVCVCVSSLIHRKDPLTLRPCSFRAIWVQGKKERKKERKHKQGIRLETTKGSRTTKGNIYEDLPN
jgi:hypothetical protein